MDFTIVYKKVPEGYIGFIEELSGTNSQAETLEELKENLKEAIQLVHEANKILSEEIILGQHFQHEKLKFAKV